MQKNAETQNGPRVGVGALAPKGSNLSQNCRRIIPFLDAQPDGSQPACEEPVLNDNDDDDGDDDDDVDDEDGYEDRDDDDDDDDDKLEHNRVNAAACAPAA